MFYDFLQGHLIAYLSAYQIYANAKIIVQQEINATVLYSRWRNYYIELNTD